MLHSRILAIVTRLNDLVQISISEDKFDLAEFLNGTGIIFKAELDAESAFIDRQLKIVHKEGFALSPMDLTAKHKSLAPELALNNASTLLLRQFTQTAPILPPQKFQKMFDICLPLALDELAPRKILVLKFASNTSENREVAKAVLPFLTTHLHIFKIHREEEDFHEEYIAGLQKILHSKSPETASHCIRVADLASRLGKAANLTSKELKLLRDASLIHDIGIVHVPNEVLNKAGSLTPSERQLVEDSVEQGYSYLQSKKFASQEMMGKIILCHMERIDGKGYPKGLHGQAIPRAAKILAIANAYDAMTARRPYQSTLSMDQAIEELRRCSMQPFNQHLTRHEYACYQFDADLVNHMIHLLKNVGMETSSENQA